MQTTEFRNNSELRTGTGQPLHELLSTHMNKDYNTPQLHSADFSSNYYPATSTTTALPPVVYSVLQNSLALVFRALQLHPM
jgi:hypothetical protein